MTSPEPGAHGRRTPRRGLAGSPIPTDASAWAMAEESSLEAWAEEDLRERSPDFYARRPMMERSTSMEGIPVRRLPVLVNVSTSISDSGEQSSSIVRQHSDPLPLNAQDELSMPAEPPTQVEQEEEEDIICLDDLDERAAKGEEKKKKKKRPESGSDVDEESARITSPSEKKKKKIKPKKTTLDDEESEKPKSGVRRSSVSVPDAKSMHDWEQAAQAQQDDSMFLHISFTCVCFQLLVYVVSVFLPSV